MDTTWYYLGVAIVAVVMCVGLYGIYIGRRTGRKRR